MLIQSGDDPGGIAAFREAVRLQPDYADAHANLGAALTPTDAEEAVRELEKAVALAPGSVKARFNLAAAYGASPAGGPAKEIEQLEKMIELDPTFARAHVALGKAYLRDGKVAEAVKELAGGDASLPRERRGALSARPGPGPRRPQGGSHVELQKGRELVKADDRDQTASLDVPEGRAALEKGDLERAAAKLRHAIQLRPDFVRGAEPLLGRRSWRSRGLAARRRRRSAGAEPTPLDDAHAGGGVRGLHPRGPVRGGRAAPRRLRARSARVLLGLVRARLQPASPSRRSARPSRPWPSRSSSTSRTPRPTRSSAAR